MTDWFDEPIETVSSLVKFFESNCAVGLHTLFRGQPLDDPLLPKIGRGSCKPGATRAGTAIICRV
jgi:hypothetical protein